MAQCKPVKRVIWRRWAGRLSDDEVSKNMEREKREVCTAIIAYLLIVGILLIYREWFTNPSLFFSENNLLFLGTKYLFPYQRLILPYQVLIFREVRDLETRNSWTNTFVYFSSSSIHP